MTTHRALEVALKLKKAVEDLEKMFQAQFDELNEAQAAREKKAA